ncbi:MAG: UDP-N-acetylglucosamine--N-acetylmuramyl-(pentapeptide) pyrophosphoryl-undecaprenol N-acetylglucosamine transferase [Clostridia bacterium]
MKKLLFCGGGTAGHIMPNLALIDEILRNDDYKIYYLGTGGMERNLLKPYLSKGVCYYEFKAVKLKRKFSFSTALLPFKLLSAITECKKILSLLRPDLVISKGGYGGLPVVIAAAMLKIKSIAHESDFSLGLANKLSLPYVRKMFTVFENAASQSGKKGIYCAAPLRSQIFKGCKQTGLNITNFSGNRPILLLLGGSLGSVKLNTALFTSLPILTATYDIIAITGKGKGIAYQNQAFYQTEFTDSIQHFYACADVAVSRAGSNTISELLANKIPSLLIPLNNSSRGEQIKNAEYYKKTNCVYVLSETELTSASLIYNINKLQNDRNSIEQNIQNFCRFDTIMLKFILNQ